MWETDQSCPDITMLPKLALVFGITTDALLGLEQKKVHTAEMVTGPEQEGEAEGPHLQKGAWEFQWDSGRKTSVGFAVWVLLVGGLLFASNALGWNSGFWDIAWPSGLLLFGLFGLYPRFSAIRLGCALVGFYFLINEVMVLPVRLNDELLLPACLLVLGLGLLIDALRKPENGKFHIAHNGNSVSGSTKNYCTYDGERFNCAGAFGENSYLIQLPRLSGGSADVSFGEMTVDLSGCSEIADGCRLALNCAFGELEILVPRRWKASAVSSTSFGSVETKGSADADADAVLELDCSVSFGEITIRYI